MFKSFFNSGDERIEFNKYVEIDDFETRSKYLLSLSLIFSKMVLSTLYSFLSSQLTYLFLKSCLNICKEVILPSLPSSNSKPAKFLSILLIPISCLTFSSILKSRSSSFFRNNCLIDVFIK